MRARLFPVLVLLLLAGPELRAQTAQPAVPAPTPEELRARLATHKGDFDYLLGDWAFTSVDKGYGKGRGYWSAIRLPGEAQVLDEFRIVGDSGQTWYVSSTLRAYNAYQDRWELVSTEGGRGLRDAGTAQRVGAEVHIEQTFGAASPKPSLWRIRYYDIQPDRFSWNADRSEDGGRTWTRDHLHIEARRIGPARLEAPLTPPRQAAPSRP